MWRKPIQRLQRLAGRPIPLILAAIVVVSILDIRIIYEPRWAAPAQNLILFAGASLVAAVLGAKGYLKSGAASVLMLGGGMLCFGLAGVAGSTFVALANRTNAGVTTHNLGCLCAGAIHVFSAISLTLGWSIRSGSNRSKHIFAFYGLIGAATLVIAVLSWSGYFPAFVMGGESTALRNVVIDATTGEFISAAGIFFLLAHARGADFLRGYWMGLSLVGLGLIGVGATGVIGSPLSWIGRISQSLGQLYMVFALLALAAGRSGDSASELIGLSFKQIELERRRAEEALNSATERLALAEKATGVATWEWDIVAGRLQWSPELFGLFGLDPARDSATFETWRKVVHPDDCQAAAERIERALKKRASLESDYRIVAGGGVRWIAAFGRATYDADGRPLRMAGTCVDITQRKQMEQALREADRRKDEFLAMLAHELRNPLSAISNALHILEMRKSADTKFDRAREAALRQARHMSHLLDDLLDVSRVTQGKITLKKQEVALSAAVDAAIEATRPLFESRRHQLYIAVPRDSLLLEADPVRLTQVVYESPQQRGEVHSPWRPDSPFGRTPGQRGSVAGRRHRRRNRPATASAGFRHFRAGRPLGRQGGRGTGDWIDAGAFPGGDARRTRRGTQRWAGQRERIRRHAPP